MGYNIAGLVINKNYQQTFDELQNELGWYLRKGEEINFETASSNWKDAGICDVYFSDHGTLLFLNMDMCMDYYELENVNSLTFTLCETSMAFNLNYCENGIIKRAIMEVEEIRMIDEGEKLPVEKITNDISEIIWKKIEMVLGKNFDDIDLDEKAVRYYFKAQDQIDALSDESINSFIVTEQLENEDDIKDAYLTYCNACVNRKMIFRNGVICNLTNEPADFTGHCVDFVADEIEKNKMQLTLNEQKNSEKKDGNLGIRKSVLIIISTLFFLRAALGGNEMMVILFVILGLGGIIIAVFGSSDK